MALARKARIIPPSEELKKKAVNFRTGVRLNLSKREIRRMEAAVEKSADKFATQTFSTLRLLRQNVEAAEAEVRDRPGFLELCRKAALDLKGLGGTFDYPLMTAVAKSLHDFTRTRNIADDVQMRIIRFHIETLYLVILRKITGEGGEVEAELLEALRAVTRKFA